MANCHPNIGRKFGRLLVVEYLAGERYRCRCDCGNESTPYRSNVTRGLTRSCGCQERLVDGRGGQFRHGMAKTPTWTCWVEMRRRCQEPTNHAYAQYGWRGITVCPRWQTFENFLADMGERPSGMSLDRIDTNGNYEPSNCRWANRSIQSRNRRISVRYIIDGVRLDTQREVAERLGLTQSRISQLVAEGRIATEKVYP